MTMTTLTEGQEYDIALKLTKYAHKFVYSTSVMDWADLELNAANFEKRYGISAKNYIRYIIEVLIASAVKGILPDEYEVVNITPFKRPFGQHPDFGKIALIEIENGVSKVCHLEFVRDRERIERATGIDPSNVEAFFYKFVPCR